MDNNENTNSLQCIFEQEPTKTTKNVYPDVDQMGHLVLSGPNEPYCGGIFFRTHRTCIRSTLQNIKVKMWS